MPGTKRKASFGTPYERPAKLSKRSTSATISDSVERRSTRAAGQPELLTLRSAKKGTVDLASSPTSASSSSSGELGSPTPSLRRASTLTLEDEAKGTVTKTPSKRSLSKSSKGSQPSLTHKTSSVVDTDGLVTKLSGLKSGSIVGETKTLAESGIAKDTGLSKSSSKKLSSLVGTIADSEMTTALASLRRELSTGKEATASADTGKDAMEVEETGGDETTEEAEAAGTSGEASLPPGGLVEVAISFDTTSSMYDCLKEVRAKIQDLVQRLQADIPGIRICVIAHGDYCDDDQYIVKWIDFGASLPEICKFVTEVEGTYGGDDNECYELVLKRAREALAWTPGSQRVLVMIGDDEPHPVGYKYDGKTYNIDWKEECALLREMNVKVYGVQSGSDKDSENFNKEMAKITGGKYLSLSDFTSIFDFLMMICYREGNPEMMSVYEHEVRSRHVGGGMAKDMVDLVRTFAGDTGVTPTAGAARAKKGAAKKVTAVKAKTSKAVKAATKKVKPTKAVKSPKGTKAPKVAKANHKKVAGAKAPTATKKRAKASVKKAKPKKLFRESLSDNKLTGGALNKLKWTTWELLITQQKIAGKYLRKCRNSAGYRRHNMFQNDSKTPAIYEISVQLLGKKKKYVMYFRKSIGFTLKKRWDVYLLRSKTLYAVMAEVDRLVDNGCSVFCRRGVPTGKGRVVQERQIWAANVHLRTKVDYAWRKYLYGKKKHRKVVRNKIELSSSAI